MAPSHPAYPVHLEASLDEHLSRWLWAVKWFLVIPHYVVLAFLWLAYACTSIIAFFAILFTGRYPRGIFDFNVGVLRWTWRVAYYAYGALATDKYPPFSLDDVADYPAHLDVEYPQHLSRGLVLVKWWLLAIPHYVIVGLFAGGLWFGWMRGGLIFLLSIVAAIVLAITARYPEQLYDVILGLNRWCVRVAAYAGLMTDEYPPFRFDLGAHEPGHTLNVPVAQDATETTAPPVAAAPARRWGAGRIVALVLGALLILPSIVGLAGGGALLFADTTLRDANGFLTTGLHTFRTSSYAITAERIELLGDKVWSPAASGLGDVQIRVNPLDPAKPVFVGIAPATDVERYLGGVNHAVTSDLGHPRIERTVAGSAPATTPGALPIWVAKTSGAGARTLVWHAVSGNWSVVAMNADASAGVAIRASIGAKIPALRAVWIGMLAAAGFFLLVGLALVLLAALRRDDRA